MRILDRHDIRIAVRTAGTIDASVPVVLVHGMAGDHATWRSFARTLRRAGRPVVSMDLRGHGRSGRAPRYGLDDFRDDLRFVLDELDLTSVDLVGHSLGAHTALRAVIAEPDRVRRLVLEEVPPMPRDQSDVDEGITVIAGFGERLRGIGALVADPMPLVRFDRSVGAQVGPQFEVPDPDWWEGVRTVNVPTLVISGGRRSFLPPQHLRSLSQALPDARFTVIDAGHSVHRDKAAEFAAAAHDFLTAT
ncbi:alpha/beta hydrolase [Gordonia sp. CPCC 206044]|uniref:alpha/beta fold hydrolase n=1 Tax=Gordonia sp. CPCC 206044 TaxID=3140793 RepID=UPI003AF356B4